MQLNSEILLNHEKLHPYYRDMILSLSEDQQSLNHHIDLRLDSVPDFLKKYEFPISPWPIVISHEIASEFQLITSSLPKIIQRCILLYYQDKLQQFEEHLNLNHLVYTIFSQSPNAWEMHFNRMDIIFTKAGIKILEMNAALKFGGWQLAPLVPQFQQILNRISSDSTPTSRNTLRIFFEALFKCISSHCSLNPTYSILVLMPLTNDYEDLMGEFSRIFYQAMPEYVGEADFFSANDPRDVKFESAGHITYKGKKLGAVIDAGHTAINSPWIGDFEIKATRVHLTGKVFFPSNPFYSMLGSKLHFALMNELADTNRLTLEESNFIKKYIPWTVQCYRKADKIVNWHGSLTKLRSLLLDNKSEFVIKIIDSGSGNNVYVGKFTDTSIWAQIVERSFTEPNWIAQEFHETNQLYAPLSNGELGVFNPVFGTFGILGDYAGSFVRLGEVADLRNKGVINSATGACESLVFEMPNAFN